MAGKKASKPRTPAERDAAAARTKVRKAGNLSRNHAAAQDNAGLRFDSALTKLSPLPRNGKAGNPVSNRGNGSPTRLSQIKRALSRVGKPQKEVVSK